MSGAIWAIGELGPDGSLTKLSAELATAARTLADEGGREAVGIVVGVDPGAAAAEMAAYLPRVLAVATPDAADRPVAAIVASRVAALAAAEQPGHLLLGATADARDAAGYLAVHLDLGIAWNANAIRWSDGDDGAPAGPRIEAAVLGGRLVATSALSGERGLIVVRPGTVTAEPAPARGAVEMVVPAGVVEPAPVRVVDRVASEAAAASIEEARIVVTGGRGVGGPEGFAGLQELADVLGGAVGATRAAVDAGWIPYAVQIGQTGKTVRPAAYLAFGVSGAIQHKVGMQTAGTIVAVNRDPDAPIAEFADLLVVGDLFAIVPALVVALRARG